MVQAGSYWARFLSGVSPMRFQQWPRSGIGRFLSLVSLAAMLLFGLGVFHEARADEGYDYWLFNGGSTVIKRAIGLQAIDATCQAVYPQTISGITYTYGNDKRWRAGATGGSRVGECYVRTSNETSFPPSWAGYNFTGQNCPAGQTFNTSSNTCAAPQCSKPAGTKITITYDPAEHGGANRAMPDTINGYGVDACNWVQYGIGVQLSSGYWRATFSTDGTSASPPPTSDPNASDVGSAQANGPTVEDQLANGGCIAHGGVTICGQQQANGRCGTVNGEYMCLSTIPNTQCAIGAEGKIAGCGDSAGAGVAPPNTAGAVPWDKLGVIDGNGEFVQIDLWGKKNSDGTYGVTTPTGGDGSGDTQEQPNGVECATNPLKQGCTSKLINGPELSSDVPSFAASMTKFKADFGATPLGEAINISIPDSAGACPGNSTFDFMGSSLSFHSLCDVGDQVLPLLGPVWLAICAWIGFLFVVG